MREDEGTWLGHVLEHVAIELQNIAGEEVTFGKTRGAGRPGRYTVVYEIEQRDEGIAAGELGPAPGWCSLLPEVIRPGWAPCRKVGAGLKPVMSSFDLRSGVRWDPPRHPW